MEKERRRAQFGLPEARIGYLGSLFVYSAHTTRTKTSANMEFSMLFRTKRVFSHRLSLE